MKVGFTLLAAGYCHSSEHHSLAGGRKLLLKFPGILGLIRHPQHGPILFDTGYGMHFYDEIRQFPGWLYGKATPVFLKEEETAANQLRRRGIRPEDISLVILSHFHADHVAGVKDFPNARFACYEHAYQQLRRMNGLRAVTHGYLGGLLPRDFESRATDLAGLNQVELPPQFRPFTTGVDLLGDRSVVAVDLPGHALGHYGILVDCDPRPFFMVGDACWHGKAYREDLMPHWLPQHLVFSDRHAYRHSLHQLHELCKANPDLIIAPSHCGEVYDQHVEQTP
jgi:glyoxylase-like metal-dependent hydrolase (beta-lactamase superfamily II)